MSNQTTNVLFYSMKCQTCNFFMTQAQKMGILKFFKLICIDGQEKVFQAKGLKIIPMSKLGYNKDQSSKQTSIYQVSESSKIINEVKRSPKTYTLFIWKNFA